MNLEEPDVSILGILSDRAGDDDQPGRVRRRPRGGAVGAGPFKLVEYRPGDVTVYERYDDYWDPDVALVKRLEIHVVPDANTRLNGLQTGQFDLINPTASQYEQASRSPGST